MIVFFSNYLNHHQVLLADELYDQSNQQYVFVATTDIPEFRRKLGYADYSDRPYLLKAYETDENWKRAMQIARDADVALFGGGLAIEFQKERLKENKLSIEVSERWLKRGLLNLLSPRLLKNMWYYHTQWKNRPLFKLCSSAYGPGDQYFLHSFKNRCYKWGYFTKVEEIDINSVYEYKTNVCVSILWCARFLKLKHPELPIKMAKKLKEKGIDFAIDMYGDGKMLNPSKALSKELNVEERVLFHGSVSNENVLKAMREHDIFLFTSDRQEGWGAVLNESMSNGCAVVASNAIGSVPYLIKDGENGMVFQSEDLDSLLEKVVFLIEHPDKRMQMAKNAYLTIRDLWSPKTAARNLLQLIDDLQHGRDTSIEEGPCSKALPL